MQYHVVIVAAGSGSRFGSSVPKQFCLLQGRPVLMHTIERMREALPAAAVTVVLSAGMMSYWQELCAAHGFESPAVVAGGATRSESVRKALHQIDGRPDVILVHDGARPLTAPSVVSAVVAAMADENVDGAIPAVPVTDSLRMGAPDSSVAVDRSRFHAVQTPQAFRGAKLLEAYRRESGAFSDDASLMEHAGHGRLVLTEGSPDNIKITNPTDLAIAELLIRK